MVVTDWFASRFGAAGGGFHMVLCKELISGQAKPASPNGRLIKANGNFIKRPAPMAIFINNCQFIKANGKMAAMAVLSTGSGHMARSLDLSCRWPISYGPRKELISGQAGPFCTKGWQSRWPFGQGRPAPIAVVSKPANRFIKAGQPIVAHQQSPAKWP